MQRSIRFWLCFIAFSAFYLVAQNFDLPIALLALLKVLPILLLAAYAFHYTAKPTAPLLVLTFSAAGDLLLALPIDNGFIFGLGAFLLAQLTYALLFLRLGFVWGSLEKKRVAFIVVVALMLGAVILPKTKDLLPAVAVYLTAIVAMAITAATTPDKGSRLFSGALLFVLSDSFIAINKFVLPFSGHNFAIMFTYYTAQALLISGLVRRYRQTVAATKT